MKSKIGFALLGLALLASCTKETDMNVVPEGQEIITLGVTTGAGTRAAINDLPALSASAAGVGIYGQATTAAAANTSITSEWTATPLMKNVKTTAIDVTTGAMKWDAVYAYPNTAPLNVKFFAYYPYAGESTSGDNYVKAASAGTAPVLTFKLTGEEDLMWATPVLGSRTQPASALKFNHQLTQLSFKLVDGDGSFSDMITSVGLTTNTTAKMNLETGALSEWAGSKSLMLNTSNIDMTKGTLTGNNENKEREVTLPKTVMLQPEQTSFALTIIAGGNKTATIKPVGESTFKAGKAYLITLRLTGDVPVQLGAEVIPWVTGGVGEGNVE